MMINVTNNSTLPLSFSTQSANMHILNFTELIQPISPLESELLKQREFKIGYNWGVPRFGHPEGKVGFHVKEVLDNIKSVQIDLQSLQQLRIAAIAHDTFKYKEAETIAKGKRINHGLIARRYMEDFIDDEATLDLIELHDEIYYSWRHEALQDNLALSQTRLEKLLGRIGNNLKLHYLFFRCDTMTGDKIQTPRFWFERKIREMKCKEMEAIFAQLNGMD